MTEMILESRQLKGIVDGTTPAPDPKTDPNGYATWRRRDNDARLQIVGNCDTTRKQICINAPDTSAKGAIEALKRHYRQTNVTTKNRLRMQFSNLAMGKDEDINTWLEKCMSLIAEMRECGITVDDEEVCAKILIALPPSWSHMVDAIEERQISNPYALQELLMGKHARKQLSDKLHNPKSDKKTEVALATNSRGGGGGRGRGRGRGGGRTGKDNSHLTCENPKCGRKGHTKDVCYAEGGGYADKSKPSWWTAPDQKAKSPKPSQPEKSEKPDKGEGNGGKKTETANAAAVDFGKAIASAYAVSSKSQDPTSSWYWDSAASLHMTHHRSALEDYTPIDPVDIQLADNRLVHAVGVGNITFTFWYKGNQYNSKLLDVHYVPQLSKNLISMGVLISKGLKPRWYPIDGEIAGLIYTPNDVIFLAGKMVDKCTMNIGSVRGLGSDGMEERGTHIAMAARVVGDREQLWHERTAHLGVQALRGLHNVAEGVPDLSVDVEDAVDDHACNSCEHAKSKQVAIPHLSSQHTHRPLHVFRSDLYGPFRIRSLGGGKYITGYLDVHTSFGQVRVLKRKKNQFEAFKKVKRRAEVETGEKMDTFGSDGGGEYVNGPMTTYLQRHGIRHAINPPYHPQWNGVSERYGQTVVTAARAMMWGTGHPEFLWGEAISAAAYVINLRPSSKQGGKTPYEAWYKKKPNIAHLRVWGCKAFVHLHPQQRTGGKFADRAIEAVFVGYTEGQPDLYRFYIPTHRKVICSRDAIFHETEVGVRGRVGDNGGRAEGDEGNLELPRVGYMEGRDGGEGTDPDTSDDGSPDEGDKASSAESEIIETTPEIEAKEPSAGLETSDNENESENPPEAQEEPTLRRSTRQVRASTLR